MSQEIEELLAGNEAFRKKFYGPNKALFHDLIVHGQKPKIMVIACSDSRVDPSIIFNCEPGSCLWYAMLPILYHRVKKMMRIMGRVLRLSLE